MKGSTCGPGKCRGTLICVYTHSIFLQLISAVHHSNRKVLLADFESTASGVRLWIEATQRFALHDLSDVLAHDLALQAAQSTLSQVRWRLRAGVGVGLQVDMGFRRGGDLCLIRDTAYALLAVICFGE